MKKYQPYEYQKRTTNFILNHECCAIMLNPGMGKKVAVLTALYLLKYDYFEKNKILIVTQKNVAKGNWENELNKWEHLRNLRYSLVVGSDREKLEALRVKADVYITNFESVQWLVEFGFWDFDTVVLDGLSNFKNERSKRFKAIQKVRPQIIRMIGLTTMPAANGLEDLWAEFFMLDGGKRLGKNKYGFYERYFFTNRIWYGKTFRYKRELKNGAEEALYSAISDICVTAETADMTMLPISRYEYVYADMDAQEYSKYHWLEQEMLLEMEDNGAVNVNNSIALTTKLLQMANGVVYDNEKKELKIHERKIGVLKELIERCNGENILIVYWFQHDKNSILKQFPEARVIDSERDICDWNNNQISIGLMNPVTLGDDVDMHRGGNILIWYSLTWSLKLYERMNGRLINYIDKNNVLIYHILTRRTLDEKVIKILGKKEENRLALLHAIQERQEELWDRNITEKI